jgi:hypothetical protein
VTRAPILSSLRRMVPQVTLANWVDSKDDSARRFYERERFLPFPDQPRKLFRPMAILRGCSGQVSRGCSARLSAIVSNSSMSRLAITAPK